MLVDDPRVQPGRWHGFASGEGDVGVDVGGCGGGCFEAPQFAVFAPGERIVVFGEAGREFPGHFERERCLAALAVEVE